MAERVLIGVAASEGSALGPAFCVWPEASRCASRPAEDASAAFEAARALAAAELATLIAGQDRLGAEILEVQAALLEDEEILTAVEDRLAKGASAATAWRGAMEAEITTWRGSGDAGLAARADDLTDLRDRVLAVLAGTTPSTPCDAPEGAILIAPDLTPSAFLQQDWGRLAGAALGRGSANSHVALLARARGMPMLTGLGDLAAISPGATVAIDAARGALIVEPSSATAARLGRRTPQPAAAPVPVYTASGRRIRLLLNIDATQQIEGLDPAICDGIGLVRTELLFPEGLPGETAQCAVYERLIRWAAGRPVTIRTMDAGGDKPAPGDAPEANPFLGLRGIRRSLRAPEVFRTQLRAIARAARLGPVTVLLPMISAQHELAAARAHLDTALAELSRDGTPHAPPALGIMVETPAAALSAGAWEMDSYSIGSNDLIQYVTAAARDNPEVEALADPCHPAVLELIARVIEAGRARNVEVSLCGEMAAMPALVPRLLDLGLGTLSVPPNALVPVRRAIEGSAHG